MKSIGTSELTSDMNILPPMMRVLEELMCRI